MQQLSSHGHEQRGWWCNCGHQCGVRREPGFVHGRRVCRMAMRAQRRPALVMLAFRHCLRMACAIPASANTPRPSPTLLAGPQRLQNALARRQRRSQCTTHTKGLGNSCTQGRNTSIAPSQQCVGERLVVCERRRCQSVGPRTGAGKCKWVPRHTPHRTSTCPGIAASGIIPWRVILCKAPPCVAVLPILCCSWSSLQTVYDLPLCTS